ncbi:undecaprenyl-diphosphate phosphatase [Bacillus sp. FJAT-49731]|uniref:Undecaprenyl-diphosphatase n=1 Tax=Lederbergia citrea TaxID=2833581 RepID=A0A942UNN4_9BACI|nr:undecaprenyl-diphosphate phosphatase [Lederbergia citrea]MBS4205634.1 undecaprenyl-diphosphate phosphatase [Lederbergia citrea]MBS4224030.1 undecaprenyl-diphosphate phosphatase [Lederbergia citrea]
MWDLIVALILGIVEGLTEFAPVSSTGHMIIVDDMLLKSAELLGSPEVANTFKVVIQLGSIMAVVIVFWSRLWSLVGINIGGSEKIVPVTKSKSRLKLTHVIIGLLPAVVFGFTFESFIDKYLFRVETVLIGLIAGALLMILADWKTKQAKKQNKHFEAASIDEVTYKQALLIGLFQCIALWPGFSRSGATISGGVLMGLKYRAAADFTFIMAVPIMFGASAVSLLKKMDMLTTDVIPFFAVGFISAFFFAWLSIRFFLALISRIKLLPFAIYRIVLAVVLGIVYINMM